MLSVHGHSAVARFEVLTAELLKIRSSVALHCVTARAVTGVSHNR